VTTPTGRLSLTATAQFLWQEVQSDPGRHEPGIEQFKTRRLHFGVRGAVSPHAEYGLTFMLKEDQPLLMDANTLSLGVYEAWIDGVISPSWRVRAGSFLPPWTLTLNRPVHELEFIRYPLIVDAGEWLFTPWRQTGIMVSAQSGEEFYLALALMNGLDTAGMFFDDNSMKDTMIVGRFEIYPGVCFFAGYWGGTTALRSEEADPGETVYLPFGLTLANEGIRPVEAGGGVIEHNSLWLGVEAASASFSLAGEVLWNSATRDERGLRSCFGYQLSMAYTIKQVQGLLRYEFFNPDVADNEGGDDEKEWTTLGLNLILNPHAKLMANYIFKTERRDNQRANEEFLLQLSAGF
jgi:hypothetical protein